MKTYLGYRLERRADGSWTFTLPDDYRDPEPADPAVGEPIYRSPWTGRSPEFGEGAGFDEERAERAGQLALVGASGPAP